MEAASGRQLALFGLVFSSALLLFFGLSLITLMVWPVLASKVFNEVDYQPYLPIAQAREEVAFDLMREKLIIPYPALSDPQEVSDGNWIYIPSIGVRVPLALSPSMQDADVLKTLDIGAALYPNGVEPGHLGNTFISAHSTGEPWKGTYRFAFLKINELSDGNYIHLDYEGTRYSYRIVSQDIVTPEPGFRLVSDRPVPTVTLMACWPLWSVKERMLIKGELTNVTKLTQAPALVTT